MDTRSRIRKIYDFSQSVFREFQYALSVRTHRSITEEIMREQLSNPSGVTLPAYDLCDPSIQKKWKKNSEGLHVLIHGLNSHPSIWDNHLSFLQQKAPSLDTPKQKCRKKIRLFWFTR